METREEQERELATAALNLDIAAMVEEAGRDFIHLFKRFEIPFEPATFCVTYVTALCSQIGIDGEQVISLLKETGRLTTIVERLESDTEALSA